MIALLELMHVTNVLCHVINTVLGMIRMLHWNNRIHGIVIIVVIGNSLSLYYCSYKNMLYLFLLSYKYQYADCNVTQANQPQIVVSLSLLFSHSTSLSTAFIIEIFIRCSRFLLPTRSPSSLKLDICRIWAFCHIQILIYQASVNLYSHMESCRLRLLIVLICIIYLFNQKKSILTCILPWKIKWICLNENE